MTREHQPSTSLTGDGWRSLDTCNSLASCENKLKNWPPFLQICLFSSIQLFSSRSGAEFHPSIHGDAEVAKMCWLKRKVPAKPSLASDDLVVFLLKMKTCEKTRISPRCFQTNTSQSNTTSLQKTAGNARSHTHLFEL